MPIPRSAASLTPVEFAEAARALTSAAKAGGYRAPTFRSPPRLVGVNRTIRRRGEWPVVAVRTRQRPWSAVVADMVEGVVVANELCHPDADRARNLLWEAVDAVIGGDTRAA